MKRSILFTFIFLLFSFVLVNTFAQENSKGKTQKETDVKTAAIKSPDGIQVGGDKVIFKDGSTKLLEIENLDNAGGLILYNTSVIGGGIGKYLQNNGGNLFWDGQQLGLASGGVSAITDLLDARANSSSLFLGANAGENNNTNNSLAIGQYALNKNNGGSNTALGIVSMELNTSGAFNVAIGTQTLRNNIIGSGNIAIGYSAGKNEIGSNKLYIENSESVTPLIYGEFDNDLVKINGALTAKSTGGIINMESSTTTGWISLNNTVSNTLVYKGYLGIYTAEDDIDVGTGGGNTTGNLNLVTNATPRVVVSSSGDVDVKSGELNRSTKTGAANLLPIAYGNIAADGTINSGTGNFTVTWTAGNNYNITIPGESLNNTDYTYLITGYIFYNFGVTFNGDGTVFINTLQLPSGTQGNQAYFSFVIYKP